MASEKGDNNKGFEQTEFDEIVLTVPKESTPSYEPSSDRRLSEDEPKGEVKDPDKDVELDDGPKRMQWDSQWEFLMSCISMSVGLGNVWRFPVTAYENGGGAFLVPYFIVLIFMGRPIYFLELCLGQFASSSQVEVWKCVPIFKGVGYGSMIATMAVLTYYVCVTGITCYYFILSFSKTLPWSNCDERWAGEGNCNGSALAAGHNSTVPEMYFVKEVLKEYKNIENGVGNPDWKLSLCLVFCWVFILLSLIKGCKSSGKVAYFTAIFPYIVMPALLIRGLTLDGAWTGIRYFIEPKWGKILEPGVWYAAVSQCFFSLNTGFGSIIMFASYNPFNHNIYRDAWIVSFMDTFTSLLAGFTIFAVLGNLAHQSGTDIDKLVEGGTGLAFISYPEAISKFPVIPQLFAVLFFMMLFTLGIGSAMSDAGAVVTIFCDQFPDMKRWVITLVVCVIGCAFGLVYCTPGGQFIVQLVDFFGGTFVIYTMSTLEVIGVAWIYGVYNFIADINFMLNIKLGWYWKICWGLIIPVGLTIILVYSLIVDSSIKYKKVAFPTIALVCGWLLAAVALLALPIGAIHSMWLSEGTTWFEKFTTSLKPRADWGPRSCKIRAEWKIYKESLVDKTFMAQVNRWRGK